MRRSHINQLENADRPAHDWYRFILSFPPHLVRDYLRAFNVESTHCVLDPFCGTGTTLVECKKLGIPSIGIEANPIAHLASSVKVDWQVDPEALLAHAEQVAQATVTALNQQPCLRTLDESRLKLLLKNSISSLPLHKTLILLEQLQQQANSRYQAHESLALAKSLISAIGNLHFGPEVGVEAPKSDAPVLESWLSQVGAIATDLQHLQHLSKTPAVIHRADARQLVNVLEPCSIDAVITSPPYPNEKDYTRTTRLESVLLGFIQNKADLQALKRGLVRSNSRGVYKSDDDDQWVSTQAEVQRIAETIEQRRLELGKTSGFERVYGKVTKLYFGGMAKHLAELRPALRPGAQLAYVVGDQASYLQVMIRTGQLLAEIAEQLGYEVVRIDLFRTRDATITKTQMREEVVVLRWAGS
jgi:DNA modification methylase